MTAEQTSASRLHGLLLGTAVGDSLGLPVEGLSRRRASRLFPGPWRQRLVLGRGMISDDTEHTVFVCQALLASPASSAGFARRLARSLRWWVASAPAGIGLATLRATLRLWLGFSPRRSGVRSAGNGPAMRSAPIGAFFAGSPDQIDDYVRASTRLTHTDPRALVGATAVARLASWSVADSLDQRPPLDAFLSLLEDCGHGDDEWAQIVERIGDAAGEDAPVAALAASLGLEDGVTGYVYHTVPVAAYAWYYHLGDFRASLETVLECGGDTDTAGAIVGALAGAVSGASAIPREWIEGLCDWPRGRALFERLAVRLDEAIRTGEPGPPERYFWPGLVARNLVFTIVVLAHGMRRLGPPY